jgi:hypothetical protein
MSGRFPVTTMLDAVTRLGRPVTRPRALPLLRAATDRDLPGGTYVGLADPPIARSAQGGACPSGRPRPEAAAAYGHCRGCDGRALPG